MGRPFIEFVQSQALPWQSGGLGARTGIESKVLSLDNETGALSALLRYPAGWSDDRSHQLLVDEELFVLDGDLTIDGTRYTARTYAHLPGGLPRSLMSSSEGGVVLTFFSGEPEPVEREPSFEDPRLVRFVDALAGDWGSGFHPRFPPGAGRKWLRRDPVDGEETWILGTMPLRSGRRAEKHPVVEEMYLLSGELVGPLGVMRAGAYFWRPPQEWHGPFGSLTGNLMLFRTKGGPLSTVYEDEETGFSWDPQHRPILPPELQSVGLQPWSRCGCTCY